MNGTNLDLVGKVKSSAVYNPRKRGGEIIPLSNAHEQMLKT